jgi:NAD(P)-dependent dehydrogenase (short-subunit alcohol dehydrogenase family)
MNIWVAGGNGGIGGECVRLLAPDHQVFSMEDVDVHDKYAIMHWYNKYPQMDALVYAVGLNHLNWSSDIEPEIMNHVFDINVTGLIRCLQVGINLRRVVVIGSDAARRPMRTSIAYNASKAALEAAVRVIARERAADGFVINVVAPGLIANTAMTDYVMNRTAHLRPGFDLYSHMIDAIPAGMPGRKLDVAVVVKWLLEASPSYLNGTVIDVSGAR